MKPLILSIAGEPKSGKTHFACTAPQPIRFFDFDIGSATIIEKFKNIEVVLSNHYIDLWRQARVAPIWKEFEDAFKDACLDGTYQTIVLDTGTQLWEMVRLALFEKVQKEDPDRQRLIRVEYAAANSLMEALLKSPKANGKNLVVTHYIKDAYDSSGNATGFKEPDQFKYTNGIADIILSFEAVRRKKVTGVDTLVTIQASRDERDVVGTQLTNPTWDDIITVAVP